MIDPTRLRTFRAVVASGSVGAAAQNLGYTPSAVSQQVAALAKETGLALLEKSGRGVVPTPEGLALVDLSDEVIDALGRLDRGVSDLRAGRAKPLRIGYFPSVGATWIPPMAQRLGEELSDIALELKLTEGAAPEVVAAQDVNVLPEHVSRRSPVPAGYSRHVIHDEPYLLVVPAKHPLAQQDSVRMEELSDEPWVDPALGIGGPCKAIMDEATESAGLAPRYVAQSDDHYTALGFVAARMGIAVLPRLATLAHPPGVRILAVTDPVPTRRIVAHVRAGRPDGAGQRAVEILRELAASSC